MNPQERAAVTRDEAGGRQLEDERHAWPTSSCSPRSALAAPVRRRGGGVRRPVLGPAWRCAGRGGHRLRRAGLLGSRGGANTGEVRRPCWQEFGCYRDRRSLRAPRAPPRRRATSWSPIKDQIGWPGPSRPSSCVGETLAERETAKPTRSSSASVGGDPHAVGQASAAVSFAYEPVGPSAPASTARPSRRRRSTFLLRAQLLSGHKGRRHEDPLRRQRQGRQCGHAVSQAVDGGLIGGEPR